MQNSILRMIGRRIVQSIFIIFIVTCIVFLLMQMVPGDPVTNYLGPNASKESIEFYTKLYGLDQPVFVQYFKWIAGLFHGQMGHSIIYNMDVSDLIFTRLSNTLSLVLPAFVISVILGVLFGVIAALNRGKPIDTVITIIANLGMSMPLFWACIVVVYIFALKLDVLPAQGFVPFSESPGEWLEHAILPIAIIALGPIASFARQTRSSMLEVVRQDYIRTAEAKGLGHISIILKHQLRNALIPIVTVMGMRLGGMIGGTVLVESIFNVNGLGNFMITAINSKDYMVVESGVFLIASAVACCNLIVDILYGIIDPRIRADQ